MSGRPVGIITRIFELKAFRTSRKSCRAFNYFHMQRDRRAKFVVSLRVENLTTKCFKLFQCSLQFTLCTQRSFQCLRVRKSSSESSRAVRNSGGFFCAFERLCWLEKLLKRQKLLQHIHEKHIFRRSFYDGSLVCVAVVMELTHETSIRIQNSPVGEIKQRQLMEKYV